ncbi:Acyl carrier protein phosphodiesterase [Marinomonas spartinae]|uniref:Acyl carrier protein phosphodiesterase n=1 Tax=Marinomonas spartinae TaxID=1792290 RepID=A0A1A8TCC2_9GAMM|nr:ACP phosphodiesterase [Marinomonas spartinae]SBS30681.1 Acyl carrier protein phosphodiesterase [Marinomonas spartinae]SBS36411.1 Acyl carrier protein phosphodiesterase [Marinomonas spartinae]
MNYFAHLHIAERTQTSFAGNLLGDFSVQVDTLPDDLLEGWRLHQKVDVMVDEHEQSILFRSTARAGRRRFAGIVQDIVMDYWLIRYWSQFSDMSLALFCQHAVTELVADAHRCPERLQKMIRSLEQRNWLADLGTQQGVENAIRSIMRRWRHGQHLQPFIEELPEVLAQGEAPFLYLYPDLLAFVDQQA